MGRAVGCATWYTLSARELKGCRALSEAMGVSVRWLIDDAHSNSVEAVQDIACRARSGRLDLAADLIGSAIEFLGVEPLGSGPDGKWTLPRLRAWWPFSRERTDRLDRKWHRCVSAAVDGDGKSVRRIAREILFAS